jgi:hypothetical protein
MDIFGCTRKFRDELMRLQEANSSLVGLVVWMGFRSAAIPYRRKPREIGRSAWTFARKWRYLVDSIFAFTDLPLRLLTLTGTLALACSFILTVLVLIYRFTTSTPLPGYSITVTLIMFFGGVQTLGISLLGGYLWRTFENTKRRPGYLVASAETFEGRSSLASATAAREEANG